LSLDRTTNTTTCEYQQKTGDLFTSATWKERRGEERRGRRRGEGEERGGGRKRKGNCAIRGEGWQNRMFLPPRTDYAQN